MPSPVVRLVPAALSLALTLTGALACTATGRPGPSTGESPTTAAPSQAADPPRVTRVLAISVDGLRSSALTEQSASRLPTFHRLISEGATTLDARTEREQTVTLPNHTSMLTGRRIDRSKGGHGVTWDDDRRRPATVRAAAGHPVSSVFRVVAGAGRTTALFTSKEKFSLYRRSWTSSIDRYVERGSDRRLTELARRDLRQHRRGFTFLHLSTTDQAGHAHGWRSRAYRGAVRSTDERLGRILATIDSRPRLRKHLVIVLTADHGGTGRRHNKAGRLADYRIPFLVWGAGVAAGRDLYSLNPAYADPGRRRTSYAGKQPVRNGDVANLACSLLGLHRVPGSLFGKAHRLRVR